MADSVSIHYLCMTILIYLFNYANKTRNNALNISSFLLYRQIKSKRYLF